jgi:hypothetical protein
MTATLGPLDASGRVPAAQQTRVAGFLMSAHGAAARLLAGALAYLLASPQFGPLQVELHAQLARELEFVMLLGRATAWQPDPMLPWFCWRWEMAWLPRAVAGVESPARALTIDIAALGYALHTAIRPAMVLPAGLPASDAFGAALRRIELEGSRIVQAQLRFLKGPEFVPVRDAIETAVDQRHRQVRQLWTELLASLGVETNS